MKKNEHKRSPRPRQTLAELINVVAEMTQNERLSALIVADMINSRLVRLEGQFRGRRVVVA